MATQTELQDTLCKRAQEIAVGQAWQGPGRFGPRHYRLALEERSPAERDVERGMAGVREPSQGERASRHQDQLAAKLLKTGEAKSYSQAVMQANAMAPNIAKKAGAAGYAEVVPDELGQPVVRVVPRKRSDAETKLAALTEADVVELLVSIPAKGELILWQSFLREWCILTAGRYPAGQAPRGPAVDASNALQERLWQVIRQERLRRHGYMD